jgi:hypothetical protein
VTRSMWMLLLLLSLVASGCGQLAKESEFWDHSSMYKDWGHMLFSMGGYRECSVEAARQSNREGWWGITMPCGTAAVTLHGRESVAGDMKAAPAADAKAEVKVAQDNPEKKKVLAKKERRKKAKKSKKKARKAKTRKTTE